MGFAYNLEFDPVLLPGETATLKGIELPADGQPVLCVAFIALPEYEKDFGPLTAATWKEDQEDENLELGQNEFAQMRMIIKDDFKLKIKNPSATELWRTAKQSFYLRQFPTDTGQDWEKRMLWRMSEFYIWEDNTPRFNLYSEVAQSKARVLFRGWKFFIKKIDAKDLTSKQVIWLNSWPAGA